MTERQRGRDIEKGGEWNRETAILTDKSMRREGGERQENGQRKTKI